MFNTASEHVHLSDLGVYSSPPHNPTQKTVRLMKIVEKCLPPPALVYVELRRFVATMSRMLDILEREHECK